MRNRDISAPQLLTGFKLLAVLPPVGIAWLIYLSRWQWSQLFKRSFRPRRDPLLAFMGLLIAVTALSLDRVNAHSVVLSFLMLLVLSNLWLLCQRAPQLISLASVRQFIIHFGLYLTISGNFFRWLNQFLPLPSWLKFLFGDLLWGYSANQNRLFGSAYNPNDACCLILIALALLLADFHITVNWQRTTILAVILCLGIYQTQSRTGLAIMLGLLVVTVLQLVEHHRTWLILALTTILLLLWNSLPRRHSVSAALQTRLSIWHNSFILFKQSPLLGVTYFGFPSRYFQLTGSYVPHAHDILLMFLASFGILGGLGFLLLVAINGWTLTRYWRTPNFRYFITTLPAVLAYGTTDFILSSLQVLIIILILSAYWYHERQVVHLLSGELEVARKK